MLYRGATYALYLQVIGAGLGYGARVLFARWAGATEYGIYAYVLAWMLVLTTFASVGLSTTVMRFIPQYLATENWPSLHGLIRRGRAITTLAGLAICLLGSAVVLSLDPGRTGRYTLPWLLGVWTVPVWATIYLYIGSYRAFRQIFFSFAPRVLLPIFLTLSAVLLIRAGRTLTSVWLVGCLLISLFLIMLLQLWRFPSVMPSQAAKAQPTYHTGEWLSVALPVLFVGGALLLTRQIGVLMIGVMLEPEQAGIYDAAAITVTLLDLPIVAADALALPTFASLTTQQDHTNLQQVLSATVTWNFLASTGLVLFIVALSGFFLGFFGPEFEQARQETAVLAIGGLAAIGVGPVKGLLQVTGHQREAVVAIGISALIGAILSAVGVYFLGIMGVAIASVATKLLWSVWLHGIAVRSLGVHPSIVYALRAIVRRLGHARPSP